jgi:hypothetical protein
MLEINSLTVLILLSAALALLVILLAVALGIRRRLSRIEQRLVDLSGVPGAVDFAPASAEHPAGGTFEMFLGEQPARKSLPKGEQFKQYRKWRQEKGLNWSNS